MAEFKNGPDESIRQRAGDAVRSGADIRNRVHDLTLEALTRRRLDREAIRQTVRAVAEGATLGAEESRADLRKALADAFRGMDEALTRTAEAGRSALQQMAAAGRDFSDAELKRAAADVRKLEDDFLATVGHVADAANEKVAPEMRRIVEEARASGTATGREVSAAMTEVAQRLSVASIDVALAGVAAAAELGGRFAMLAGGVLAGMADALQKSEPPKKDPG
ncbi:MAG: DUF6781 family protein [Betaproteobacteria bacterium]